MSSDSQCAALSDGALKQIYRDIIEHMKIDGTYDNIRMKQVDPIQNENDFQYIIDELKDECDRLCKNFDLSQHRNTLRKELESKLDYYSSSKNKLQELISRALKDQEEDLKTLFCKGAETFLRDKFIPQPCNDVIEEKVDDDSRFEPEFQAETDMDIESSMDDNEDADLEIERPPYSPIGNSQTPIDESAQNEPIVKCKIEDIQLPTTPQVNVEHSGPNITNEHIMTEPCLDEIPIPPEDEDSRVPSNYSTPEAELKRDNISFEHDTPLQPDEDSDDLEKMTFSSVSTINTADLDDGYENSIRLSSDDEASLIGKPKNSKVPLEVVRGQLPPIDTDSILGAKKLFEPPERADNAEPAEINVSDEGCSESTVTGRRVARTRKSNPRYSNGDYKLL